MEACPPGELRAGPPGTCRRAFPRNGAERWTGCSRCRPSVAQVEVEVGVVAVCVDVEVADIMGKRDRHEVGGKGEERKGEGWGWREESRFMHMCAV